MLEGGYDLTAGHKNEGENIKFTCSLFYAVLNCFPTAELAMECVQYLF